MRYLALTGLLLLAATSAQAQPVKESDLYPRDVTVLSLTAEAHRLVPPDRLSVTLRIEREADTGREVQSFINDKMKMAVEKAKSIRDLKAVTGGYYVNRQWYPVEEVTVNGKEKKRKERWNGSQTLTLEGSTFDDVLKLAGELQDAGFVMSGTSFFLSREKREVLNDELTTEAAASLKARADKIAAQVGSPKVHIARINSGGNWSQPPMPMMARAGVAMDMAMEKAMPAPTATPDEQEVSVSLSADVLLSK